MVVFSVWYKEFKAVQRAVPSASEYLENLGNVYRIHPASIKDCLTPGQQQQQCATGRENLLLGKTPVGKILSQISGQYFPRHFKGYLILPSQRL